ncbi:MAG: aminotransferase class V-fold PLP-dependent enzyme [Clostridiales bacterium]|nr:aminotransferase class V-fold PLP-dependent enzyme [Clostridiales bacterium]
MSELLNKLIEYADSDYLPMHMPGHKRRMGEIGNPFFIDITEIGGFDNLHHAEGILLEAQERAAALYHSEETHYLVNGSTAGILSAVSGCVAFGGKLLLARNSHKSAYHAALLRGLQVEYLYPHSDDSMGINGPILPEDVEKALKKDSKIQAVMVTSPTYDGVVSDIREIAGIVHAYGIPLIVDEAHGAHFPFSEHFPEDSVVCGADVVIHSMHKTLPTLTQTALIHMNGTRIDREKIRRYLTIYQTSSPSYVLMASLDSCVTWIREHGDRFEVYWRALQRLREGLRNMNCLELIRVPGMDESKILVSTVGAGITGHELDTVLRENFHVEMEMACSTYVCAITSVGDTKEDLERLLQVFMEIDKRLSGQQKSERERDDRSDVIVSAEGVCTILEAEESQKEECALECAVGRISGDFVTLYPPGIPILAPGERISGKIAERIMQYREDGFEIHGINNKKIKVMKGKKYEWKSDCV